MNKDRRNAIAKAIAEIQELEAKRAELVQTVEDLRDEEQEYFDNMPESFQQGEKGSVAEAAISAMDSAIDQLGEGQFDDAVSSLEEASE